MKIVVVGLGYVGTATALTLQNSATVVGVDIDPERVRLINVGRLPVKDPTAPAPTFGATVDLEAACEGADFAVICVPTDGSPAGLLDVSVVEAVARAVPREVHLVIRSTCPVGFINYLHTLGRPAIYVPEFLTEGAGYLGTTRPDRVVVGCFNGGLRRYAAEFVAALRLSVDTPVLYMSPREAETVKLMSNAYLATRIAFFNELDTFLLRQGMDSRRVIDAVGLDPRIGSYYNNPSFGFGGYCLPKDTAQLAADTGSKLLRAVEVANQERVAAMAEEVLYLYPGATFGVYLLGMKEGSDNLRNSTTVSLIRHLYQRNITVVVYDPGTSEGPWEYGARAVGTLDELAASVNVVIANRVQPDALKVFHQAGVKVYTRDLYGRN